MRLAFWEVQKKDGQGDETPALSGEVIVDNKVYNVVLWKNTTDNPKAPVFKGKLAKPKEVTSS